ncbi:LysR family transcriptional regulator [Vulcaniibacterium tengchongense]|uniref:LysR family transcriptional regulator n=1 Tax=Vulcaniibacterium tengchongense TaxID=1273429 RepID=A0A3N4V2M5_9GAMM|nr:LysR family transcriptional regulator [Vulcaniibacterium tengchongense]RPE77206.1 LysR family transcriptional regulator [Vulcaniibacterium tengchongense]
MKPDFTIDRLKRMALFARVVDLGSMSAAARELDMTASAVSQQVRRLEAETGIALLHRSTRKLTLTEAGQAYYEDCAAMLLAAQSAERRLADLRDEPRGELRIAFPVGFSRHLAAALAPLLRAHPRLSLRLFAEDRRIDLIAERIDLAIRIGTLGDSALVARRLAQWRHLLVAAPAYAQARGLPRCPEDLARHAMLILSVMSRPEFIELHRPGEPARRVRVSGPVAGNNAEAVKQMMLQGLGIARMPGPDAAPLLASGEIVAVLPEWSLAPLGVYALTARRDSQPAKVRLAIAAIRDYLDAADAVAPGPGVSAAPWP